MPKKIKHTKSELKKQKDALEVYTRFLPTLILKKQQLQSEILRITNEMDGLSSEIRSLADSVDKWVDVFGEDVGMRDLIKVQGIESTDGNIAGIDIPIFEKIIFDEKEYDLLRTPLWVDFGLEAVKKLAALNAKHEILKVQRDLIREELRITTQRVNLFEKVKIPETIENIRVIRIFLGDLQTAGVVTGKIAKKKIEERAGVE